MLKQTIVKVTTNDTKKTYTFLDGKPSEDTPQLWLVTCNLKCIRNPNDIPENGNGDPILILERQSFVDCGKFQPASTDKARPEKTRDIAELLIKALRDSGVLKHVEEAILQSQESSDEQ